MLKTSYLFLILPCLLFSGCIKGQENTEVLVHLSEIDFIHSLSMQSGDSAFITVFNHTKNSYDPGKDDFIDLLAVNLLKSNPSNRLSSYFASFELKDKINYNSTDPEVVKVLKEEVNLANEKTMQVFKKRIETTFAGTSFLSKMMNNVVAEYHHTAQRHTFTILINKKVNRDHLKSLLQRRADLGFWETYKLPEIYESLNSINELLKKLVKEAEPNLKNQLGPQFDSINNEEPLFYKLNPSIGYEGKILDFADVGASEIKDTALVNKLLSLKEAKMLLPRDLKFMWEFKPITGNKDYLKLYAIKSSNRDGKPLLDGSCIVEASGKESTYNPVVSIKMNEHGAKMWARITKQNIGRQIAIAVNQKIFSCPVVNSEITGGNTEISGSFTINEAMDIANMLNAGAQPKIWVKVLEIK